MLAKHFAHDRWKIAERVLCNRAAEFNQKVAAGEASQRLG